MNPSMLRWSMLFFAAKKWAVISTAEQVRAARYHPGTAPHVFRLRPNV